MANLDRPCGFECKNGPLRIGKYEAGSAVYPGSLVNIASDGQVDEAAAGGLILGVAMNYAAAAGDELLVADHPDQIIIAQLAASEIDVQSDIPGCADILATAGNSTYRLSRQEVDGSTLSNSATAQLRLLRIAGRVNNAFGANVLVECAINEHQLGPAQANAGVGV
jgi:hypothetical protein